MLLSGQLDGAWICGYPFAQFREQLSLIAVPVWRGKPLYQSYLIAPKGRVATSIDDLKGDIHAFSDPNSNSGYLGHCIIAGGKKAPARPVFPSNHLHLRPSKCSSGCRIRAGPKRKRRWLCMASDVIYRTRTYGQERKLFLSRNCWVFRPIACLKTQRLSEGVELLHQALVEMSQDDEGRHVLNMLKLDGFADEPESLFDTIAAKMMLVRGLGS